MDEPRSPTGRREPRRVLILPLEIAGYAERLQRALPGLGWKADVIDVTGDPNGYGANPPPGRLTRWALAISRRGARTLWGTALTRAITTPWRLWFTLVRLPRYDAVVYLFGSSLLGGWDMRWARRRGTRVLAVFLGSDSRPPYLSGMHQSDSSPAALRRLRAKSRRTARRVARVERSSDLVVCNPASAQFLSRPFVNWFAIGMPGPGGTAESAPSAHEHAPGTPLRVLHAPTRPLQKGTQEITSAVTALGSDVILGVVTAVPNREVLDAIAASDLVIDELYADAPIGGLGIESADRGVPALNFGYAAEFLRPFLEPFGVPTAGYLAPGALRAGLTRAVRDEVFRRELVVGTRSFAHGTWSPTSVATRFALLLDETVPEEWVVRPDDIDYAGGWGMSESAAQRLWQRYLSRYGLSALYLRDGHPVARIIVDTAARAQEQHDDHAGGGEGE